MRILVVEDDERLAAVLRRGLTETGHVVDVEHDGLEAESALGDHAYDVIVLDVGLPGRDGFELARSARARGLRCGILMLTSRDTTEDLVRGLDAGADDYLRKPFVFAELDARLRSLTRRVPEPLRSELRCGDLVLDLASRQTRRGAMPIALTARETAFLEYLMRNEGIVLTRPMIEDALWERDTDTASNLIEVYVRRLRAKLSPLGEPPLIHTVRGAGYRFGTADD